MPVLCLCPRCAVPCFARYRAKFIVGSVAALLAQPGGGRAWLLGLREAPLEQAVEALVTLPGGGEGAPGAREGAGGGGRGERGPSLWPPLSKLAGQAGRMGPIG